MDILPPGARIGSYRVVAPLARGAFSRVYLGEDEEGARVALKIGTDVGGAAAVDKAEGRRDDDPAYAHSHRELGELYADAGDHWWVKDLYGKETDGLLLAQVKRLRDGPDPGLLREVVEYRERPVLVMRYVEGKSLRDFMDGSKDIRLGWFAQLTQEFIQAREGDWSHGDLKPENIIITPDDRMVSLDPAVSVQQGISCRNATPAYNPLLLTGEAADVVAIGIMLYEITTGQQPFPEPWTELTHSMDPDLRALSAEWFLGHIPAAELNPRVEPHLNTIIERALGHTLNGYTLKSLALDMEHVVALSPQTRT